MADTTIDLNGFDNSDLSRVFSLKSGDANSSTPYDLTSVTFEMDVRDAKGALVLHLDTDSGIVITDAPGGTFSITIMQGQIEFVQSRSLKYDLLMLSGGATRRLWGGTVRISQGVTVP
jgi:hypothetical protein